MWTRRTPFQFPGPCGRAISASLLGALLLLAPTVLADDERTGTKTGTTAAGMPSADAEAPTGPLVLYWDEAREILTPTPIPGARTVVLSLAERQMLRRSAVGLRESLKADPAAGFEVDLEGRFQSVFVSVVDLSGRLRIVCLDAEPGAHASPSGRTGGTGAQ